MSTKRVAIVTGGANGIGACVSTQLAAEGRSVAIFDLDGKKAEALAKTLSEKGGVARGFGVDVMDAKAVQRGVDAVKAEFGRIDILVNCVGGSRGQMPVENITEEDWDGIFRLNLRGLFLCTKTVVPIMKAQRYGRIVNVSSLAGRTRSFFGGAHYTASKAAVIGFTRQVASEVAPFGISCNVVAPGVTLSERVAEKWEQKPVAEKDFILKVTPAGRAAEPEEAAAPICFLCRDEASFVCGAVLDVNGGLYIGG